MTTTTYTPVDIVKLAAERDAAGISSVFSDLIGQRIQDAVQAKKLELAQSMFMDPVEAEQEVEAEADQEVSVEDENQEEVVDDDKQSQEESEESNENAEEHN